MAQLWRAQVSSGAAIWAAVNGDGAGAGVPAITAIEPTEDGFIVTHSGGGTHIRLTPLDTGIPQSWTSLGASPLTITGLGENTEWRIEISSDGGSTIADSIEAGTLNPGEGGGGVDRKSVV